MKNYLLCIFLAVFTISIYGQNHKNAADYRTDAINGNAIAQFYLGQSYFRGWGIKPDTIQAVYWWRKSAEQGNPAAQNNMGAAYSNGWGNLTQNKETAIYWYKKAAEKNGAFPQKNLGRIYEDKENYEEAFIWYKKAAEHNNSPESYYAQSRLAYLLKNGLGVTKNYPAGMAWTKRAAKNGNASGQISLAISYEYGIDNILRKDGNSALYWYKKAALNKDIGELQKSIAEAAIERLEEAGFNGQNTLLKMIPDYKPFYTAPSESEQKSMHESVRNSTVEWGKTIEGEASLGQTQNDEINGFRVEFKEDNIKIGFTKNSEFTLFIHIQEDDIIVKNGSENGVEYNRNTGKPYMLLRPYSYEIEAKEYPGQIFERTNYTNGNKYWGETYNGQRHGYGIHIWENGNMWFGPWKDGERNGYGAYFDITAHTIQSGKWIGNELIAGTSYICKEKAEPVLPARTRTVSKPFSYSGTVRYINLPTSSYMSYITEAINKWGKCRTGAITMYGAGVGVYGNSGYAYTGSTPSKLKKRIEEANSSNAEITDINITENGNYVIILGGSGYWTLGYPDAFLKKLEQYRTGDLRDDNILSACFNDRGEWVVITDKHYSYSNETIKNFILKAEELYEEVYYAYITNYGMIACCKNGVYYKNIPSNLAEALKKLTFKPKVIKFTDNGLYLITDGESQNYYFSLFPSVCSHFTDTFSCQLNPVRRMYNTIHNGICYCRVSDCIIPIVRWQLRGDDDGLAPMSVLYYIEQDGSFLGIKVHKEEVIQYEQRAPFDSLEFRFQCAFYFCHLKRTHKFRSIRIICPYALLAGFIPHCCGKEALPGTGCPCDEEVLSLADELQRCKPLHLIAVKATRDCIVYLLEAGLVAERRPAYKALDGCIGTVVPFPGK